MEIYEEGRGRADILDSDGNIVKDGEGAVKYRVLMPMHDPKTTFWIKQLVLRVL